MLKKIDIWKFRTLKSTIDIFEKTLQIILTLSFITLVDYRVSIVVILFLIPLIINNIYFPKKMEKSYREYIEKDNEQLKKMKEYFDSILIIKNNNEENEFSLKMNDVLEEQNFLWKKTSILGNLSAFIANSGVILSQFAGIFVSILFYKNNYISLGSLIALIQLTMFINQPVINLINSIIGINSMGEINNYIENINFDVEEKNHIILISII
ncbi:ABC transporter ATP-binding protein [Streptobacillus moniliformis]|nr:ABC transporter ATP-binding protein [Streptobacillus moniliformis]